jgi:tellurite resistance protein TehA-like permease
VVDEFYWEVLMIFIAWLIARYCSNETLVKTARSTMLSGVFRLLAGLLVVGSTAPGTEEMVESIDQVAMAVWLLAMAFLEQP